MQFSHPNPPGVKSMLSDRESRKRKKEAMQKKSLVKDGRLHCKFRNIFNIKRNDANSSFVFYR